MTNIISINISGPVQSGKSAVLSEMVGLLRSYGYCVAVPDSETRNNPPPIIGHSKPHEKPSQNKTVFVVTETVEPTK